MTIPERYKQLATSTEINEAISKMAQQILHDYDELPLFIALLRGAAPFASKLLFEITRQSPDSHPELDYMMVSTYGSGQVAGSPRIVTDIAPNTEISGRSVLVLDDVLDKGITAEFVFRHVLSRGALDVQLAVLANKDVTRTHDEITASYEAFHFGNQWLVGMGMDDAHVANEGYRWLEEIWEISQ